MKKIAFHLAGALLFTLTVQAQQAWTLQQCIEHALEHNIELKQQKQAVVQQEIALSTSRNSRLPNLQASANQSFNFGRGLTAENTYANRNTMNTGLEMSTNIPLYTGGRLTHDIAVKGLDLQVAMADLNKARESLSIQVASYFLEVLYQKELFQIAQNQLELSKAQQNRIGKLLEAGKIAESDYAEAKAVVAGDESTLVEQQNNYLLALLNLSQMLELETPEGFDIEAPILPDAGEITLFSPDAVYQDAVATKPRIKAEEMRVESAKKSIGLAKSALYPTLTAGGGLSSNFYKVSGFSSNSFGQQLKDNFSKYIGVSLSIPIFNRYATRNQIRQAQAQHVVRQLQLDQEKKNLYKEIQQAYYTALAAQAQCKSLQAAEEAANTAFVLVSKKFENGKANATEYLEARTKMEKAQANLAQAKYSFFFRKKILDFYQGIAL